MNFLSKYIFWLTCQKFAHCEPEKTVLGLSIIIVLGAKGVNNINISVNSVSK